MAESTAPATGRAPHQRVLITGAAGTVGTLMRPRLRRPGRTLRLLDLAAQPAAGDGEDVELLTASVTDPEAMAAACRDVDAVLHLGGLSRENTWEATLDVNIHGTRTVLEAARAAGVPRVILASSNHAVGFRDPAEGGPGGLPADSSPRPDTYYGVSKAAMEALGSLYHSRFGMDVLAVRIGSCFETPLALGPRGLATWLSPDDGARLFEACLTAPSPGYRLLWGVSANTRRYYSLTEAESLGYTPRDDAERFAPQLDPDGAASADPDRYVGGGFCTMALGEAEPSAGGVRPAPGREEGAGSGSVEAAGSGSVAPAETGPAEAAGSDSVGPAGTGPAEAAGTGPSGAGDTAPAPVWSVDPRTGTRREQVAVESGAAEVDRAVRAAAGAAEALRDRARRAAFLRLAASALEGAEDEIVPLADAESALGAPRLSGELARSAYQLRSFAEVVETGGYLGLRIDHADTGPARPDLRRMKVPLGVVAVFGAANFPLAFSVPGGDTASALAAGCPVVVKAHPDHPATSELCARLLRGAARESGLPADVLSLVHGFEAGTALVRHPLTAAVGFTGSVRGGRALHDLAAARPRPIPFHGELGSLNPVVLTARAAATRGAELGAGLAASFTLGTGQFCVKPGLVLVPAQEVSVERELVKAAAEAPARPLLDPRMREAFLAGAAERAALPGVEVLLAAGAEPTPEAPLAVRPGVLAVPAARLHPRLTEECFGPLTVLVRYADEDELGAVLGQLDGNLTATVHLAAEERGPGAEALLRRLEPLAGRLVVDGWPTGVAVAPAMQHGGPYPASTSNTTSVGTAAIDRWLRPITYQNTPDALLPPELRETNPLCLPRELSA
ncbi:aldehyde dehydrogenase family protein [Streptomyces physcomitrii]|nr:aldehyde dehydrogenase family protein [Streptomyces physcomitrii]